MRRTRWLKTAATIGVLAITAGSWWLSFTALVRAAGLIGLQGFDAYIWAGLIDAFIGLGTVSLVVYREESRKPVYPTVVLVIFGLTTIAWNAALAPSSGHVPDLVVRVGWGMPPAAMFMAWHLLISLLWPHQAVTQAEPVVTPIDEPEPARNEEELVLVVQVCEGCGSPLIDPKPGQKFCAPACKQRAYRAAQRNGRHADRNGEVMPVA